MQGKEVELVTMQQKQVHDRLQQEHEQAIQALTKAHKLALEIEQQRNTALEQMVQKLQFQAALVDTYFKKKEESLLKDHDSKVSTVSLSTPVQPHHGSDLNASSSGVQFQGITTHGTPAAPRYHPAERYACPAT